MTQTEQKEKTTSDLFVVRGWRKIAGLIARGLIVETPLNNPELTEWRRDQCLQCPNMDRKNIMCNICKCFLEEKTLAKTNKLITGDIVVTHCPEGKWNDLEIANFYNNNNADETHKSEI